MIYVPMEPIFFYFTFFDSRAELAFIAKSRGLDGNESRLTKCSVGSLPTDLDTLAVLHVVVRMLSYHYHSFRAL